ncbi:ABC transporter ATP-binding protein [Rhodoferax sp. BAB1]|uniref:ABC transporter ATP-binding protein n=1 Tax=Rhodoferax sp. BAB1 TaxID=2741720 RepID=UPI00157644A3|nr:ABC transporter ATP-binding protein [Rhodoferax sp. BAB1]QKO23939.1 ABC transporter ATP-binding protein [Rhodoferax sp. BAB1]
MLLASFAEILSIGAVLPFLGVLTAPERIFVNPAVQPVIQALGITSSEQLVLPLTVAFCLAALIAGGMRLLLLWATTRLSFSTGAELSISIYRRTLYQPYAVHCARNSSEVISGISSKASNLTHNIIVPALMLISAIVILIAIVCTLFFIEPIVAIWALGGFGSIYFLIIGLTRKKLLANSQCVARESVQTIKSLQEGLGGIRDVLIDGSQSTYCQTYATSDLALRRAQGNSVFIGASPRYAMESLGMLLIAALAYSIAQQPDGIGRAIPILGALAIGAQRLLPALQQAYGSWSSIKGGQASLQDTLELLDQPLPDHAEESVTAALPFSRNICLKQLGFRYGLQTPYVLKELNLIIPKGSRIGFVGTTGSGKSTLLDVVMGLLPPTDGSIEVDGQSITLANSRAWQAHIAHVPQVIFLTDSSIEENIAFGVPKELIDHERVRKAALQAKIAESIESWPEKYQTVVGERGVRLSGGQRQRIGIARALYKQADVIIFDEATSALDSETEQAVMQAIDGLGQDLTLLIIAHRVTTLKNCTQIVELGNGGIMRIGSYPEFCNQVAINQ